MESKTQGNEISYVVSAATSKDGTKIGYRQYGRGAGVILVMGAMGTAHNYDELARDLAGAFTVYVPDRRGRGMSPREYSADHSIQRELEDLDSLLAHKERERACDEAVLSLGNEPGDYADAILTVCRLCVESPLTCVSGVTGPSISPRIRAILTQSLAPETPYGKQVALLTLGLAAVAAPIVLGVMSAPVARAQRPSSASTHLQAARGPSRDRWFPYLGTVTANTVVVTPRVDGQLISVNFKEGGPVEEGQVLASIDAKPYRLQLEAAESLLARDQEQLAAMTAPESQERQASALAQLRIDRAKVEIAKRLLSYAEVTAPITGMVGLRLVDAGNIVHSGDRLAVITQLRPVSVLFNIQQVELPDVLARLKAGANPTVILFDRGGGPKRLAVGRLVAADNQLDTQSGTVTLKATFDNDDEALFPNQFVNVRLLLNAQ
jgi:multidrug efflux pump subunit AcrA (membrane-fusion protein)